MCYMNKLALPSAVRQTGISMNVYSSTPVDGVNALLKTSVTAVLQWFSYALNIMTLKRIIDLL